MEKKAVLILLTVIEFVGTSVKYSSLPFAVDKLYFHRVVEEANDDTALLSDMDADEDRVLLETGKS